MSLAPTPSDHNDDDVDPYLIIGDDETCRGEELRDSIANRLWVSHQQQSMFNFGVAFHFM